MMKEHTSTTLTKQMLEYYRLFAKEVKHLFREPQLSDFYHWSEGEKHGKPFFVIAGTGLATYAIYKYLK